MLDGLIGVRSATVAPGSTVQIPIEIRQANDIGSMNFVLAYDPAVLVVANVERGALLGEALFAVNTNERGTIRFGLATLSGVSGSGALAYVEFEATGGSGSSSPIALSEMLATDTSGEALYPDTEDGVVTVE